ncbi:uncharacterized protein FSUBG_10448 [Fusarium subglutinans]|uniref:Uncharacterized protein n=1 Tax=Gibberella subglutinans TaxID=42677 RepID=A0A8H5P7I3_GIBSU|nr:uncharacterized protein FSUBG_10448 [Fusarium subglutinans]KAF5591522.1 hypothetical protein FSUBG_10448 [Fusarium subglutinans]
MADIGRRESQRSSELIRQGIRQCLTLEAECKQLKESLSESKGYVQKLEARMDEMTADHEGLLKILAEKDALIESYSALMSETLDKSLQRERQELKDVEAKVLSAMEQSLNLEMNKMGLEHQGSSVPKRSPLRAKRPGLIRQGAIVPCTSTSERRRQRNSREAVPRLLRQDAQMYDREDGEQSPETGSLLDMAR